MNTTFRTLLALREGEFGDWLDANLGGKWWRVIFLLGYVMFILSAVFPSPGELWYNRAGSVFLVVIGTHALTQFGVWGRRKPPTH